jgi:hypothetical protein
MDKVRGTHHDAVEVEEKLHAEKEQQRKEATKAKNARKRKNSLHVIAQSKRNHSRKAAASQSNQEAVLNELLDARASKLNEPPSSSSSSSREVHNGCVDMEDAAPLDKPSSSSPSSSSSSSSPAASSSSSSSSSDARNLAEFQALLT